VWATLSDIDGSELGRAAVIDRTPQTVTALVAAAGPVYALVDSGEFGLCAGASYAIQVRATRIDLAGLEPTTAAVARAVAAGAGGDHLRCICYSKRAETLSVKIRRTVAAIRDAAGGRRASLRRKRASLARAFRSARTKARRACR
jgi:hypothetical protein